jgi:predicted acylesterase/phospholipase RssA
MPADIRLCLSLSGGASLGAYQAGATAALPVALGHLRGEQGLDVRLDAVGGVADDAVSGAVGAIEASRPVSMEDARRGHAKERDLPWRARLRLALFLLRTMRALLR